MILEIPDTEQLIENPSLSDIKNALLGLTGNKSDDSCIDINKSSLEFLQAIGCKSEGFILRFKNRTGNNIYESIGKLPLDDTLKIIEQYLHGGRLWKNDFKYEKVATVSKLNFIDKIKQLFKI